MGKLKSLKILALIPARGKSKRLKNKNIKIINGKPLIFWTIDAAKKSKYINNVTVTSDCSKILKISKKYLANVILRPKSMSGDVVHAEPALIHAYKTINKKFDYIVMLQPTCPLRTSKHIDEAIKKIYKNKKDSLLSVCRDSSFLWEKRLGNYRPLNYNLKKRPRHQDTDFYRENGSIYIIKSKFLLANNNRLGGKIDIYLMNKENSIDIDNAEDFRKAHSLMKKNKNVKYS
jgi:CMP-N,N'-diacetyllegionaminic acid synthase